MAWLDRNAAKVLWITLEWLGLVASLGVLVAARGHVGVLSAAFLVLALAHNGLVAVVGVRAAAVVVLCVDAPSLAVGRNGASLENGFLAPLGVGEAVSAVAACPSRRAVPVRGAGAGATSRDANGDQGAAGL